MERRLNKVIELLEDDAVVFCAGPVLARDLTEVAAVGDSSFDCCLIETEHHGFDTAQLHGALQQLLNRRRIAESGSLQPSVVPIVRVPPEAAELPANAWVVKQILDSGAYGMVVPRVETVAEVEAAVALSRYPGREGLGAPDGRRGWSPRFAPRYWGLTPTEYHERAGLWGLDPGGELILVGLVETTAGVRNIDSLVDAPGLGAIWIGTGDLAVSLGVGPRSGHPAVEEAVGQVLAACLRRGVPAAILAREEQIEQRIEQGFRMIVIVPRQDGSSLGAAVRRSEPRPRRAP